MITAPTMKPATNAHTIIVRTAVFTILLTPPIWLKRQAPIPGRDITRRKFTATIRMHHGPERALFSFEFLGCRVQYDNEIVPLTQAQCLRTRAIFALVEFNYLVILLPLAWQVSEKNLWILLQEPLAGPELCVSFLHGCA